MHTMSERKHKTRRIDLKALAGGDRDFLRELIRTRVQEALEAKMTDALGAAKSERTAGRNIIVPATTGAA
jgi:transposase-like protein